MSQEFEKIVLEKLNSIDQKLDEHTEEFKKVNKVLDEHTEEFKKVNKVLDEHTEEFKKVNKVLDEHTEELEKVNRVLDEHSKEIKSLSEITMSNRASLINLERTVNDISNTTRLYGNMLIEHEYDLNLKFNTLMDAFSLNKQKHAEYDDLFLHYNEKAIDHDIRLFKLENDSKHRITA